MNEQLTAFLRRAIPDCESVVIEQFMPIPGGFSRETYRFDAIVRRGGQEERLPCILRKDPPAASAILHSSRELEHDLIEAVRTKTRLPVSRSWGHELDASVFGERAMVIERAAGNGQTSALFNGGPDADLRGALIGAVMMGLSLGRFLLEIPALKDANREDVERLLLPVLTSLVEGPAES